ncbi:MAG: hypothetical protein IJM81_00370 [Prevotella sp.]|nr:hypothetical protein [Prevotella sp.]
MAQDLKRNSYSQSGIIVRKLEYTETAHITTTPTDSGVAVTGNAVWGDVEFSTCEVAMEAYGTTYNIEVTATFEGTANNYAGVLTGMMSGRWVVRLTDLNGDRWLVGTEDEALRFEWSQRRSSDPGTLTMTLKWKVEGREPIRRIV